jgi:serine/threonine-protein kinase HipA
VIARNEKHRAADAAVTPRSFGEIDYLLGVRDDLRQGALRFRDPDTGVFLADEDAGVPPLLDLPMLLSAAEHLVRDEASPAELALLLRAGSSLGGARPKAHILDPAGRISIAKFPSPSADEWNVMLWEAVALQLAAEAGIEVSARHLYEVDGKQVLVVQRFDRIGEARIGYVSALTMLERTNGDQGSYLEIADAITSVSPNATADLHELWRRIAFSILISNFDDHLRNHGFLRKSTAGWTLAPAFDLNPDPRPGPRHLHTAIDFDNTDADIDLLISVAGEFRVSNAKALEILEQVRSATERWRSVATELGASTTDLDQIEPAFDHAASRQARALLTTDG